MKVKEKLEQLGLQIPEAPKPLASYVPALKVGDLVYTAGQIPMQSGSLKYKGKVGESVTLEDAIEAAKICAVNCISAVKSVIDDLDSIERIVKVTVFVASATGFYDQPKVANGASDLLVEIFGEHGKHVRSAVGVNELPIDAPVEIEMVVKVS